jgi:hypothetical protein
MSFAGMPAKLTKYLYKIVAAKVLVVLVSPYPSMLPASVVREYAA